jgi:carbon-monoxide dehydrogenase medium subunit
LSSFDLVEPRSFEEALGYLDSEDPAVRPIGGGTALMLMMKAQIFKPARLVSLRHLTHLSAITIAPGDTHVRIGAMTTFAQLEHSADIARLFPAIPRTMLTLANVRVRNVATIGGNLAHGDPHLDLPPVWTALGATVDIRRTAGSRTIPVEQLFAGYYETTLQRGEVIEAIEVPVRPGWRAHYAKITTRSAHDWPALGIAVAIRLSGNIVEDIRLVLSAAVDRPTRLASAEGVLRGAAIEDAVLAAAGEAAVAEVHIESDLRGTAAYKKHLLRVHLGRAIRALQGA